MSNSQRWMSMRSIPCAAMLSVLAVVMTLLARTASADPPLSVGRISNNVAANTATDAFNVNNLIGGGESSLDVSAGGGTAVSIAAIRPGSRPEVDIDAMVSSTGVGGASMIATVNLVYYLDTVQVSPFLVYRPATIPVLVNARGEASASGSGNSNMSATGSARVEGPGGTLINEAVNAPEGILDFNRTIRVDVPTGEVVRFAITLHGSVGGGVTSSLIIPSSSGSGQVQIDPLFTFDQEAFNQQALNDGAEPFLLEDFFGFQPSPDIAVPEPASALLLVLGLSLLIGLLKRRRARPSHCLLPITLQEVET